MNTTRVIAPEPSLSLTAARQLDDACARFEEAWQSDTRPSLGDFLTEVPEVARTPLLLELIKIDVHYRRRAGDTPTAEEYQRRFPALPAERVASAAETISDGATTAPPAGREWVAVGHEILGELGRGGMGVVYKARHVGLNRLVALKMIRSAEFASPAEVARFRVEAEAVARLQHPNIVPVYEVGECSPPGGSGRVPYLSLEFVGGGTLAGKFSRTPQPARFAAEVVEAIARGVQHAHENGIVHRDLKPANVLLTPAGTPKVTDFGLAKLLDADDHTHTGAVLGTPAYMAPEQADGRTREIGPATDVYALGGLLYEALTGGPPFRGENAPATLEMVRTQAPVPPTRLLPTVPRDLEVIALKCLEKEAGKRYPSAAALADDLRRYLDGRPILARPVSAAERGWRWCRRNPALAVAGGMAAAAVLAVAVVSTVFAVMQTQANRDLLAEQGRVLAEQQKVTDGLNVARTHQLTGSEMAYGQGLNYCEQNEVTRGLLWLARAVELAPEDATDLHARVRRAIGDWTPKHPRLRAILDHDAPVRRVEYHPSGKWVATSAGDVVQLWDADVKSPTVGKPVGPPMKHPALVGQVAFSPDGTRLATVTQKGHLRLWQTDPKAPANAGTPLTNTIEDDATGIEFFGWGPDNQTLAVTSTVPCRVTFWRHQPGKPLAKVNSHKATGGNMVVTRGNAGCPSFLVWLADEGNSKSLVQCYSFETQAPVSPILEVKGGGTGGGWFTLSPNGHFVLISQETGVDLYQIDPQADPVFRKRLQLPQANTSRGVFGPTDVRAAILGQDGLLRVWNLNDADGAEFGKPIADPLPVGERVYFLDVESERELLTLSEHEMRSELAVWDVHAQVDIRTLARTAIPYGKWVQPTKFQTSRRWFIPGLTHGVIWDARTRHAVGLAVPFADNAEHWVAVAPDDSTFAPYAVYQSSRVCLWSLAEAEGELTIPAAGPYDVTRDGRLVATLQPQPVEMGSPTRGTARVYDGKSGTLLHEWEVGCGGGIAISPDGARVLVGGVACELWDVTGEKPTQVVRVPPVTRQQPSHYSWGENAFSPGGNKLLLVEQSDDTVIRFLVNTDERSTGFRTRTDLSRWSASTGGPVGVVARPFSADSRRVFAHPDETGELWVADADTGKPLARLEMRAEEQATNVTVGFATSEPVILGTLHVGDRLGTEMLVFRRWDAVTGRILDSTDAGPRAHVVGQFTFPGVSLCVLDRAFDRGRFDRKELTEAYSAAVGTLGESDGVTPFPSQSLLHTAHNYLLTGHLDGYQLREFGTLRRVGLALNDYDHSVNLRFTTGRVYWQLENDEVGRLVVRRRSLPELAVGSPAEVRRQVERLTGYKLGGRGELVPLAAADW